MRNDEYTEDESSRENYGMEGNSFGAGGEVNSANSPQQGDAYGQAPFTDPTAVRADDPYGQGGGFRSDTANPGGNMNIGGQYRQGTDRYSDDINDTAYAHEGNQYGTGGYTDPANTYDELGSQQTVFGRMGSMDPATRQAANPWAADPLTANSAQNGGSMRDQYIQQQRGQDGQIGGQNLAQYANGNLAPQEVSSGNDSANATPIQRDDQDDQDDQDDGGQRDPNIGYGDRGDLQGGYGGNRPGYGNDAGNSRQS